MLKLALRLFVLVSCCVFGFSGKSLAAEVKKSINSPQLQNGKVLQFDGIDDFVVVPANSSFQFQNAFTIESWIYMDDWSAGQQPKRVGIISKAEHGTGGYELGLDIGFSQKTIGIQVRCAEQPLRAERPRSNLSGGWHHFVATLENNSVKLFTDGELSAVANASGQCTIQYPYNFDLRFGRSAVNSDYGSNYFAGRIDEPRIYNRALTVAEIAAHYNDGQGSYSTSNDAHQVGVWHLDEGSGAIAFDSSGRNFHAHLVNDPLWIERTIDAAAIVGVRVDAITESSAVVRWHTAAPSTSTLEYGSTINYGTTIANAELTTEHQITLTNLAPYALYHFKITSVRGDGNTLVSQGHTLRTLDATPANNQFFAAPNGSPHNNGSFNSPWDLKTALNHPANVLPGAFIWLRGGTYRIPPLEEGFTSSLNGTANAPIKVASYQGEWAVIDGNRSDSSVKNRTLLKIYGSYVHFVNFEITNTEIGNRKIDVTGSNPDVRRANSIDDYGTGTKLINLVIHDTGQGIGAWQQGRDNEYYGNIVYNNGWDAPDRGHGHGTYTQNYQGFKTFEDNILFNHFAYNTGAGGTSAAALKNYLWKGNVFFNGTMGWTGPRFENFIVTENFTYNNPFKLSNEINRTNLNATVTNNYFMSGVEFFRFENGITFRNNTVFNTYRYAGKNVTIFTNSPFIKSDFDFDNNTYYKSVEDFPFWHFKINYSGKQVLNRIKRRINGDYAFNQFTGSQSSTYNYTGLSWQEDLRIDLNSTYFDNAPTGVKVFVRPNKYDANRAFLIIYNWDELANVEVNVNAILQPGDTYELRNVQDYFNDVLTGTFAGGNLVIPMTGRTRAKPIGYDSVDSWYHDPLQPNTFPKFGVFVLTKTASGSANQQIIKKSEDAQDFKSPVRKINQTRRR